MIERTPEQYAIEFGLYLVASVRHYLQTSDAFAEAEENGKEPDFDAMVDARRGLNDAIGEFEKRANRATPKPAMNVEPMLAQKA